MNKSIFLLLPFLSFALCVIEPPSQLKTEYASNPLGVDVPIPRFSWINLDYQVRGQAQTAFQIQVTRIVDQKVVWDSLRIFSNISANLPYGGPALQADERYSWIVRIWDKDDNISPWSAVATFSTGLYSANDWKGAQWIGSGSAVKQNLHLRRNFTLSTPVKRATAYIVGLGFYKLFINGIKISDHQLGPFTTFQKRVYYDTWDATDSVKSSTSANNVVAVSLGPGWYAQPTVAVGPLSLYFRLSILLENGDKFDVVSDLSWKQRDGPITLSDIYQGETYDARLETKGWTSTQFDDSKWSPAVKVSPPSSSVAISSHAVLPPIRIYQSYSPCNFYESSPGTYVFDFCQNMAGFTTLKVPSSLVGFQSGITIKQQHSEAVTGPPPATILYDEYGSDCKETTIYITSGDGSDIEYTPSFTYMGFRYVALSGYPGVPDYSTLTAHFVHTDYALTGDISFSDPNLDGVQHITRTAAMSNFQSIPTDCPQRERRGWLGDAQLSAITNIYNFDMAGPYTAFVRLINDAQDPDGATQDCVPYYGHGNDPADPAWGAAYTFIADYVATYYDDNLIFKNHYPGIVAHLESLIAQAKRDNIDGLLGFSWWGDWCPPAGCAASSTHSNSALVSSFMYIKQLRIVAKYAKLFGKTDDAAKYSQLDEQVSAAFNKHFYDSTAKTYRELNRTQPAEYLGPQTCISLAAALGLIPTQDYSEVINNLVQDIVVNNKGHLNLGIVGVKELLPTLSNAGRVDVALQVVTIPTPPSWVYMWLQGATTLWETWTGSRYKPDASWNHIMFGSQSAWYYQELAGIQLQENTRGFRFIELYPKVYSVAAKSSICSQLSYVDASVNTLQGTIKAAWSCPYGKGDCHLAGENSDVTVSCPYGKIVSIDFASFGTPTGSCMTGFKVNPSCNAVKSVSIIQGKCVGKSSCVISATDAVFGDPCPGTTKQLAVQASCDGPVPKFIYNVAVPVTSEAKVHIPTFGLSPRNVIITESGTNVWSNGEFNPVTGITSAVAGDYEVIFFTGSGSYQFSLLS